MTNERRVLFTAAIIAVALDLVLALVARPASAQMPDNKSCQVNQNEINVCVLPWGDSCHYSGQCPQSKEQNVQ